jgi:large subunit ribosomal protein L44
LAGAMQRHAQKRLASTAAQTVRSTIPLSSLRSFPPPQALAASSSKPQTFFDTESWATAQPPPTSALTAFAHRIGLGKVLTSPEIIQQACTHQSILPLYSKLHPNKPVPPTNSNLATLGNSLLGLFASEYIHALYPHLPTRVLKAAVSAYVGPTTCASIANEMGASTILRWQRTVSQLQQCDPRLNQLILRLAEYANTSCCSPYRRSCICAPGPDCPCIPTQVYSCRPEIYA